MWKKDFLFAKRNIVRRKGFSLINIVGLAIGMSACLLMMMYVVNETLYENFHRNRERIYRVATEWGHKGSRMKFAGTMPALGPALVAEFPEVERSVRFRNLEDLELRTTPGSPPILAEMGCFADTDFFVIFSYPWLTGNRESALEEPHAAVINESLARALFKNGEILPKSPTEDLSELLGQTILYEGQLIKISGVMGDAPANSHLRPEIVLSYATYEAEAGNQSSVWSNWGMDRTYLLFRQKPDVAGLEAKIQSLFRKNAPPALAEMMDFHLQPLGRIHFITDFRGDLGPKGNRAYFYFFISAALLVLIIACFNYVNLTTSQNLERMREIGVRYVLGATRRQVAAQFLRESVLVSILAIGIGGVVFEVAWKPMMRFIGAPIILTSGLNWHTAAVFLTVFAAATAAGIIPAWTASRFKPVEIMSKGSVHPRPVFVFRKILFTLQFVITIVLLVASMLVFRQLRFVMDSDLGFVKERALLVPYLNAMEHMLDRYELVRRELEANPEIVAVSTTNTSPGISSMSNMMVFTDKRDMESGITMQSVRADYGFLNALGLQILMGRGFSREFGTDQEGSVLINETAARLLGFQNPLGSRLKIPRGEDLIDVNIIGIVKDFHVQSLHHKINPIVISLEPQSGFVLVIRTRSEITSQALASVQATLDDLVPEQKLSIRFLDQEYAKGYLSEEKTGQLLGSFSILAVILSCSGLLGLTSYMIGRRVKEIGIRKVLGSSVPQVVSLLSRDYLLMVLAANIVAWPVAFLTIDRWLRNFAYRIQIDFPSFILAGGLAFVIALLTVAVRASSAARANPVDSIRYE